MNPYGECLTKENCEAEEEHGHCQVCASGIRYGSLCPTHYNKWITNKEGKRVIVAWDYNEENN